MIALTIPGRSFDINSNQSVAIERHSPVMMDQETEAIAGDVVIPFPLPFTRSNLAALGQIDSFGNRKTIKSYNNATLWLNGNQHINGVLEVEKLSAASATAKLYSGVGALQVFKTTYLNDSALYTNNDFYFDNLIDAIPKMNASLTSDFDYVVVPFMADGTEVNEWDIDGQTYISRNDVVPFFRVTRLLEQVVTGQGWRLVWKDIADYSELLLICNQYISGNFQKTDILPNVLASDFIKKVAAMSGCVIFANAATKTLLFKKYDELTSGSVDDWSGYVIAVKGQEFLNIAFEKEFDSYQYAHSDVTYTDYVTGGSIDYTQERVIIDGVVGADKENLTELLFIHYDGYKDSEVYTAQSSLYSQARQLRYGRCNDFIHKLQENLSADTFRAKYLSWFDILNDTRLITFEMCLPSFIVSSHPFYQKIRIFNNKDGHYYTFLVKSIKSTVNTRQRETQTVECLLID